MILSYLICPLALTQGRTQVLSDKIELGDLIRSKILPRDKGDHDEGTRRGRSDNISEHIF